MFQGVLRCETHLARFTEDPVIRTNRIIYRANPSPLKRSRLHKRIPRLNLRPNPTSIAE